jgi:tetratricopeptide (TPR) repeat protein
MMNDILAVFTRRAHIPLMLWSVCVLTSVIPVACYGAQPEPACSAPKLFAQANVLLQQREYERAKATLDTLQGCQHLSSIERFNLGWLYGRAHNFRTALSIFKSTNSNVPNYLTHQYAIALTEFELGDLQSAVGTLVQLRSQGVFDDKCANLLGVAYSKLGLYKDAYPLFAQELRKNPHDLFAYLNLVTLYADTGNFAKASDIASQAVRAFPRNPDAFVVDGSANTLLGKLDAAHTDFATAVRLAPAKADPRFFLALTDYKQGKFKDAVRELKKAIAAGIVDSDLHYLLAECMLKIDPANSRNALVELGRALAIDSHSVPARSLRGKLLFEEGHPRQAVIDLRLALQIDPNSRSATYNLARAYSALGKTAEAKPLFQKLSTNTTDSLHELSERRLKNALAGNASH